LLVTRGQLFPQPQCDDFGASAVIDADAKPEKLTLPFRTKWIVPLILPIIVDIPAIWNKNLIQALLAYSLDTSLTDLILQEARTEARDQLFGKADKNPKYVEGMKSELEKNGHIVELLYTNRKETLQNVERLVIDEKLLCVKAATNGTLDKDERHLFWSKWKTDNYAMLINQLGFKTQAS
jgi:hypothetical protein